MDMDNRMTLYHHIVLSGGSTMYPGMPSRMERDIKALYLDHVLKVECPSVLSVPLLMCFLQYCHIEAVTTMMTAWFCQSETTHAISAPRQCLSKGHYLCYLCYRETKKAYVSSNSRLRILQEENIQVTDQQPMHTREGCWLFHQIGSLLHMLQYASTLEGTLWGKEQYLPTCIQQQGQCC